MFPTARYLADEGHEVTLFLLDEFPHFLPQADMYEETVNVKLVTLGWTDMNFYTVTSTQVKKTFQDFDFFIGTDYAPAILLKARLFVHLYFPAGGDLFDYPFRKLAKSKWLPDIFQIEAWRCAQYQKIGLAQVACVSMDAANEEFENYLSILKMDKKERLPALPFLYLPQYTTEYFLNSKYHSLINELRSENDFLVIQHCRQSWTCDTSSLHYKANDRLVKGFYQFKHKQPNVKAKLVLLEYGLDVEATKTLITSLHLDSSVTWLPKMFRKDLMGIIKQCDVGVGELGRSWFSYGAVYEILAMNVPFVGNRNDKEYTSVSSGLYPMFHAQTEEDITNVLTTIYLDKISAQTVATKAYNWFEVNAIGASLVAIKNKLNVKPHFEGISLKMQLQLMYCDLQTTLVTFLNKLQLQWRKLAHKQHAV